MPTAWFDFGMVHVAVAHITVSETTVTAGSDSDIEPHWALVLGDLYPEHGTQGRLPAGLLTSSCKNTGVGAAQECHHLSLCHTAGPSTSVSSHRRTQQ